MSELENNESDGELFERGKFEKVQLSNIIFKKKKKEIETFFQGYRSSIKGEPKKTAKRTNSFDVANEIFKVLLKELEISLSQVQKNVIVKQWKTVSPPIILLGEKDQIKDIQIYLNSKDLARISIDQGKQIVDLRKPESSKESNNENVDLTSNESELVQNLEISMDLDNSENDEFINEIFQTSYISEDFMKDLFQFSPENDSKDNDNHFTERAESVEELYLKVIKNIKVNEDVLNVLIYIKRNKGIDFYREVLNYTGIDQEPLTFMLAMSLEGYEEVFEFLRQDNLLNMHQENFLKITIFSFLLIKDLKTLHDFVEYAKKVNLLHEVKAVCGRDFYFQRTLLELKRVTTNVVQRSLIQNLEKLCVK